MFKNNLIVKLLIVFLFAVGLSSQAISAFKTSRIGGTKGLVTTPTKDLIASLNTKLSAFDNSTLNSLLTSSSSTWLTNADIKDLNLDLSSFGGYPLDVHELAYLTHKLATAINAGTLTLGTSQASLQDAITNNVLNTCSSTTACNESSADWVHGQVSDDNFTTTSLVNLITPSLLDDLISGDSNYSAGYTSKVLNAKSSVSISDVRTDPFFQAIVNPSGTSLPTASEIMNAINRIAGFVEAADDSNITSGEYSTAQSVVNAFLDNSDNANFTSANFLSCYNNSETARSGGANTCNKTSSAWTTQSNILANFATYKQNITDNVTVTASNLTSLDLNLSQLGTPVLDWKIDYLNTLLSDNASLVSDWQTTITNFSNQNAALWQIGRIASGASSDTLTSSLLTDAGLDADVLTNVDTTISTLNSNVTSSGLSSSPTSTQVADWIADVAGFASSISYQDVLTATNSTNGWSVANFKTASNKGYSKVAADKTLYDEALGSTYTAFCLAEGFTPAPTTCTDLTKTQFNTAKAGVGLINDKIAKVNAGTLTQADLTVLNLDFSTIGDPLADWQLDYLETVLPTDNGTTKANWQTTLTNYTASATHQFYLTNVALPKVSSNTLTTADLTKSGIDYSGIDSSPSAWQVDYLETVLATDNGTTKANWQSTVTAYASTTASAWYLKQIASSSDTSGTYSTANATFSLLQDAGIDTGVSGASGICSNGTSTFSGKACNVLGITTTSLGTSTAANIVANVRSATLSAAPTGAEMRNLLVESAGFPSGTTYASIQTANTAGWTTADYKTALGNGGWDSSSGDKTKFASCKTSTVGDAAPAGTCSLSETNWDAISGAPSALALSWNSSMLTSFIIASNDGDGGISSFKGCDDWRNRAHASVSGGSGYSVQYEIVNVPSAFSSLVINSSTGRMSYTVASQGTSGNTTVKVRAKAMKNGISHKNLTRDVTFNAVAKTSSGSTWIIKTHGGSHHTSVIQNNVRNISSCPAGYEMASSAQDLADARNMGMGSWSSTWTQPSGHALDSCGGSNLSVCNTAGVTDWAHAALVYGKNSSNKACLVFENSSRNTNRTLAPDDGTCADHSIGTSGWCVVNYICKKTANSKLWP